MLAIRDLIEIWAIWCDAGASISLIFGPRRDVSSSPSKLCAPGSGLANLSCPIIRSKGEMLGQEIAARGARKLAHRPGCSFL
jgi:hypothetical protein